MFHRRRMWYETGYNMFYCDHPLCRPFSKGFTTAFFRPFRTSYLQICAYLKAGTSSNAILQYHGKCFFLLQPWYLRKPEKMLSSPIALHQSLPIIVFCNISKAESFSVSYDTILLWKMETPYFCRMMGHMISESTKSCCKWSIFSATVIGFIKIQLKCTGYI